MHPLLKIVAACVLSILGFRASGQEVIPFDQSQFDLAARLIDEWMSLSDANVREDHQYLSLFDQYLEQIEGSQTTALFALYDVFEKELASPDRSETTLHIIQWNFMHVEELLNAEELIIVLMANYDREPPFSAKNLDRAMGRAIYRIDLERYLEIVASALSKFRQPPAPFVKHYFLRSPLTAFQATLAAYWPTTLSEGLDPAAKLAIDSGEMIDSFYGGNTEERAAAVNRWNANVLRLVSQPEWPYRAFAAAVMHQFPELRVSNAIQQLRQDPDPIVADLALRIGTELTDRERVKLRNEQRL